ncbi:OTU-domain-containing protein [Neoconidiobolus thromboides FSU 785]|nr:OTU-domain-containing protein [Neoconidiobolus thromboides FSU 785]
MEDNNHTILSLEELEKKHKAEKEALGKKVEQLKKPLKGKSKKIDKKQEKAIQNKVDLLIKDLEIKHEQEFYELNLVLLESEKKNEVEINQEKEEEIKGIGVEDKEDEKEITKPKRNRQKERKERKEAELLKQIEEAEQEALNQPDLKAKEEEEIEAIIQPLGLKVSQIKPDGHCLFNAISDQLELRHNKQYNYKELRSLAAKFIRENKDDFLPYIPFTDEDLEITFSKYCSDIEKTAIWGGELEILAIAKSLKIPIKVYQANQAPLTIGPEGENTNDALLLSYHTHYYSLGAHYNSLRS